jgi:hypothetical protein
MKLGVLMLGAYRLIIMISFWYISPFINMECPCLSHFIYVGLKSTLSKISIATPACVQDHCPENLLPAFHPNPKPVLVSVNEMGLL